MAKARKILKRVKAVKSIRTVTKTMEMVSTARFKRTHDRAAATRPFTDRMTNLVADLVARGGSEAMDHPLLHSHAGETRRDVLLAITSNRGLAGPYNSSILRVAMDRRQQISDAGYQVSMHVAGKRGIQNLKFRGIALDGEITDIGHEVDYERIGAMAHKMMSEFLAGRISGVEVAYMQYLSASKQKPVIAQILPLEVIEPPKRIGLGAQATYEFIPSAQVILRHLLPAAVRLRLYQCFLDAAVSEQVMRISSMRAATENAEEMIRSLSVKYNRTRQAQITTELAEIIGGRSAIE